MCIYIYVLNVQTNNIAQEKVERSLFYNLNRKK